MRRYSYLQNRRSRAQEVGRCPVILATPDLLMSSISGRTRGARVARLSPGSKTVGQQGRSRRSVIDDPEQLKGPRARTRIRPGDTMTQRGVMDQHSTVVGIDVSKDALVIATLPSGDRWVSGTDPGAIDALVTRVSALQPQLVVMEATGGDEAELAAACAAAALPVVIVNPRQVRAFAQAVGRTAKTDAIDAHLLALFAGACNPRCGPCPVGTPRRWRSWWRVAGNCSRC